MAGYGQVWIWKGETPALVLEELQTIHANKNRCYQPISFQESCYYSWIKAPQAKLKLWVNWLPGLQLEMMLMTVSFGGNWERPTVKDLCRLKVNLSSLVGLGGGNALCNQKPDQAKVGQMKFPNESGSWKQSRLWSSRKFESMAAKSGMY